MLYTQPEITKRRRFLSTQINAEKNTECRFTSINADLFSSAQNSYFDISEFILVHLRLHFFSYKDLIKIQPASHLVAGSDLPQIRLLECAFLSNSCRYPIASAVEPASGRNVDSVQHITLNGLKIALFSDIPIARDGREQCGRIWMLEGKVYCQNVTCQAILDHRASIHHGNTIREPGDDADVVTD